MDKKYCGLFPEIPLLLTGLCLAEVRTFLPSLWEYTEALSLQDLLVFETFYSPYFVSDTPISMLPWLNYGMHHTSVTFAVNTSLFTDEELVAQGGNFVMLRSCSLNPSTLVAENSLSTTTLFPSPFVSCLPGAGCLERSIRVPRLKMTRRQTTQLKNEHRA